MFAQLGLVVSKRLCSVGSGSHVRWFRRRCSAQVGPRPATGTQLLVWGSGSGARCAGKGGPTAL